MAEDDKFYVSNIRLLQEYIDWFKNIEIAIEEGIDEPEIPPYIIEAMMRIATRLSFKPNFLNYSFRDEMIGDALIDCIKYARKFNPDKVLYKIKIKDVIGTLKVKDVVEGEQSKYTGKIRYISHRKLSLEMYENNDFILGEKISNIHFPETSAIVEEIVSHTANNPFAYITTICFQAFLRRIDSEKRQTYIKSQIVSELPLHDLIENHMNESDDAYMNSYIEFLREVGHSEACIPMSIRRNKVMETDVGGPLDEFEED